MQNLCSHVFPEFFQHACMHMHLRTSHTAQDNVRLRSINRLAAASVGTFDDKYAGAKADDAAADTYFTTGGRSKDAGDLYYSSSAGNVRIWNGTAWEDVAVSTAGFASNGFSIAMSIAL